MPLISRSWRIAVPFAAAALLVLTACAPTVTIDAAADANNPACAPMMVALPDSLAEAKRRTTTSQATAAWGEPSVAVLRCGVTVPGPTTDKCVTINGVDWVMKETENNSWTFTTYGRNPATELILSENKIPSDTALTQISAAAAKIPSTGGCL
ncbi:hypothetical protein JOF48_002836 [Arthrobacter stackebrandtii]|uniref:DUF3515 domain-containing protein n=1 Tax=Arthrobacter stackebrandtii TaxID=272161 RepID=A0ABS4YZ15_9MICC|nr:DUF3515 family protein [Arthrobacter stackebrandtii]MBP2414037.1 hypothetical protein [Arthrobacter stackebrandtii]PYG99040.1 DUF3515 domain-containing protein [Arthrobacter stackebrandtii]